MSAPVRFAVLACALVAVLPAAAQAQAPAPERIATVNGKAVPKSRLDFILKQQAAQGGQDNEQTRRMVTDRLINVEIVAQEAERRGIARSAETQTQLELARQQLLFQLYMQQHFKANPIKDAAARAEYERIKTQRGDREYKASHILVGKEDEAKDIIAKLAKGAKFEDLAKDSKDVGSREKGGALDWEIPANYAKPFADAMIRLEKGKTTDKPVQSQFGWHVIRLDDTRAAPIPAFDDVRQQIFNALQEQEAQRVIRDLRAKAKVE